MVCDNARNREEFLTELRAGRVRVEGYQGNYLTLSADIMRITARFWVDGIKQFIERPLEWKKQAMVVGSTLGLPLTSLAFVGSIIHYILDERYNHNLLIDLVATPVEPATRPSARVLEPAV
jgi:hypothetical protein